MHPQRRHGPGNRCSPTNRSRALDGVAKWSWSEAGPLDWRRRASWASTGTRSSCSKPPRGWTGLGGPDVGVIGIDPYLAVFAEKLVRLTPALYLRSVRRENGRLVATLWSEYADVGVERIVDYVVVEHGTMPHDDLYFDLVADSSNLGEVDHEALIKVQPQSVVTNQNGR
jgi:hypothetical protein